MIVGIQLQCTVSRLLCFVGIEQLFTFSSTRLPIACHASTSLWVSLWYLPTLYFVWMEYCWLVIILFFKNGLTLASFSSFQTNITTLTTNKCEKCPSSIRYQYSNTQPFDYEFPPLTTRQGLPIIIILH